MTGSADLLDHDSRAPRSSVDYVTVHDGFTLADYGQLRAQHNEANGEDATAPMRTTVRISASRPTDDPKILELSGRHGAISLRA